MLFLGIDWGEAHHDLCLLDQDGGVLAARRITDGLAGVGELHALVAAHAEDPAQMVVGIETDRGLLAAGYQVYAVNPQLVGRYRGRHQVSRAKSDRGDAKVLADLVRTDPHNHRQVAGDSPLVEAVKVLARAHQNLIWSRQRHVNALRSALREFYPGALATLGTQLAEPEALACPVTSGRRGELVGRLPAQLLEPERAGDLARRQQRAAGPPLWHQAGAERLVDRPGGHRDPKPAAPVGGMDEHREVRQLAVPVLVAAGGQDAAGGLPDRHRGVHVQKPAFLGVLETAGLCQVPHRLVPRGYERDLWVVIGVDGGRVQERQGGRPQELLDRTNHAGDHGRLGQVGVQVATAQVLQPGGRTRRQGDTAGVAESDHPHPRGLGRILGRTQMDVASWATERRRRPEFRAPPLPNARSDRLIHHTAEPLTDLRVATGGRWARASSSAASSAARHPCFWITVPVA
jgi:Transposase